LKENLTQKVFGNMVSAIQICLGKPIAKEIGTGRGWSSSDRALAYQVQGPEFNPQY
jgi:hypothetical protein